MEKYKIEGIRKFDGEMAVRKEKVGQNVLLQEKKSEGRQTARENFKDLAKARLSLNLAQIFLFGTCKISVT